MIAVRNMVHKKGDWMSKAGKWSISYNEEHYFGQYETLEEAIAEARANNCRVVGQCVDPPQPETLFDRYSVQMWLDSSVWGHDEYQHDWAGGEVNPTNEQMDELASEIQPIIAAWLDRHKLRPKFWNIDPDTVQQIDDKEQLDG